MEIQKQKEIIQWFTDNFKDENPLKKEITDNIAKMFENLPQEYLLEFSESPNFLIVSDSFEELNNLETRVRRDVIINPFLYMMMIIASKTTYDLVTQEIKKVRKLCSNCNTDNPIIAKYCMECGKSFAN